MRVSIPVMPPVPAVFICLPPWRMRFHGKPVQRLTTGANNVVPLAGAPLRFPNSRLMTIVSSSALGGAFWHRVTGARTANPR